MDKIPVIIDCDTGIDDMISLCSDACVKAAGYQGVTTVAEMYPFRIRRIIPSTDLHLWAEGLIPVAAGEAAPLDVRTATRSEIHGDSGLGAFSF